MGQWSKTTSHQKRDSDTMQYRELRSDCGSKLVKLIDRGDPLCSDIPEWLQEFRENLVDDRVPERGDSHASSAHEVFLEPTFKRRDE